MSAGPYPGENREKAMAMLKSRLYEEEMRKRETIKMPTMPARKSNGDRRSLLCFSSL
jgi:protein subunit release factor A